ncbi:MAG: hypothetical protein CL823_02665 [Crocinitomicaceae bacterium]|nr:hypothetical protein [Crocinitomicaceae bacterium]|tara:strand:+ start:1405 stop:3771 length:2367 start_codon:yes stop_codon:yes gene_type:complete
MHQKFLASCIALIVSLIISLGALAQTPSRTLKAHKMAEGEEIVVDGELNDAVWAFAESTSDFTQYMPSPWEAPSQRTEVKIAYNDEAMYVYARMFDTAPDSILQQISGRDNFDNTDEFGLWLSPYNDGNNAFSFAVNPAGVQRDVVISPGAYDVQWNAVWRVETGRDDEGWTAEFWIPWNSVRFTKMEDGEDQVWGVNFWRDVRRLREKEYWHAVDPARQGAEVNDSGELLGLRGVTPPPRLTLYPYVSAYANKVGDEEIVTDFNGGVDVKAGLGEAFTMDMTLIPDFGQVVADNLVLNLSPYEVQLADNRPFFTEGTEIFNKTGLFYSRRVGDEGNLINATKLSGRTSGGLGVGAFQAFTNDTSAVNGLNSYSMIVLDQNLPNNSYINGISTFVGRQGERDDALVQGAMVGIRNKKNTYEFTGSGVYNRIYSLADSPENNGYSYSLGISKITGKLTFEFNHSVESEYFNPNDMGYLQAPNEMTDFFEVTYRNIEPTKRFIRLGGSAFILNSMLESPREHSFNMVSLEVFGLTKSFQFGKLTLEAQPFNGQDFFEPRIAGMHWITPKWIGPTGIISTDYRKRFAIDLKYTKGFVESEDNDWSIMEARVSPRFRVNDKLNFIYSLRFDDKYNENGFTSLQTVEGVGMTSIFAKRDFITRVHTLTGTYALSNKATIDARIRHYWSMVDIKDLYELQGDGMLLPSETFNVNADGTSEFERNYNAWSVDLGLRWFFSPGSELSFVWKNTLYSEGNALPDNYYNNWEQMLEEQFSNSLSFKALFYVDYNTLKR